MKTQCSQKLEGKKKNGTEIFKESNKSGKELGRGSMKKA